MPAESPKLIPHRRMLLTQQVVHVSQDNAIYQVSFYPMIQYRLTPSDTETI